MIRHRHARAAAALASLVALSLTARTRRARRPPAGAVVPGIEALLAGDSLHLLRGKRVGLITNHSGRDARGTSTIDLLHRAPGVSSSRCTGPEHGLRGAAKAGEKVASSTDSATGLPIHSLYGETRVPTPAMLANVDVLVYDIQDVGARVYTYQWTMALAAEAAGEAGQEVRGARPPEPIRADRVEGGVLDTAFRSFVGPVPGGAALRLTPGELLRYSWARAGEGGRGGGADARLPARACGGRTPGSRG
jgi:uncharacterized protein YbbC (DUF1343 family)